MSVVPGWYPDPWHEAALRWWDGAQWTSATSEPAAGDVSPQPDLHGHSAQVESSRTPDRLARLLGPADRVAVIDVETTGLFSKDRVVEVAVVTIDRSGTVVDEFECLTNPLRDPGPTWLHGLTPSVLADAPLFEEIAGHLAVLLHGAVVAAHNLAFDRRLLGYEFERAGIDIDWGHGLDTLRVAGGCKLGVACVNHGIDLRGAHCALHDARATAQLLLALAEGFDSCRPADASPLSGTAPRVLTRAGLRETHEQRPYVAHLALKVQSSVDVAAYVELLEYAVADLKLDAEERLELARIAHDLGLDERSRERAHREFLNGLIDAALDDGVVNDDEFEQLCRVAALLEIDDAVVTARTNPYRIIEDTLHLHPGLQVCFTGVAQTADGVPLDRTHLEEQARRHGLNPVGTVTSKNCQLLVAADAASMSGKAKNAQKFGIPVVTARDFIEGLGTGAPLTVLRLPAKGVGLVCGRCGASWMASRRKSDPVCKDCLA